jgi:catechol 2,3-dioxygenase-like lactoylglutathione lyase family enzyme
MAALTRVNHVSITVSDLDEALRFWRDLLGVPVRTEAETDVAHLEAIVGLGPLRVRLAELDLPGGVMLELFQYLHPKGTTLPQRTCDPGSMHVCLECDDLDGLLRRLQAAGVASRSPQPVTVPPLEEFGDWAGYRSVYVLAPDRVTVELVEPPQARPGEEDRDGARADAAHAAR